ncbi:13037_t:CDS:1, partial [Gigaspora margarita]
RKRYKVPSVWVLGIYLPEREDNEIEVTLFLPVNPEDKTQNYKQFSEKTNISQLEEKSYLDPMPKKLNQKY